MRNFWRARLDGATTQMVCSEIAPPLPPTPTSVSVLLPSVILLECVFDSAERVRGLLSRRHTAFFKGLGLASDSEAVFTQSRSQTGLFLILIQTGEDSANAVMTEQ